MLMFRRCAAFLIAILWSGLCFAEAEVSTDVPVAPPLPTIGALAAVPDFVERAQIPVEWSTSAQAEGQSWRYWLVDTQIDHRSSQPTLFYDIAFEPMTVDTLGDAGRYEISFRSEYQTLNLHEISVRRDGKWSNRFRESAVQMTRRQSDFESDFSDSAVSALLVIDDVRVGDVVRIAYSLHGANPVLAGQMHHQFAFSASFPVLQRNARVLYPIGTEIDARAFNDPPEATQRTRDGALEWRVSINDIAAQTEEQDLPSWYIDRPTWVLASRMAWADVVQWALPLYPDGAALPQELKDAVAERLALPEAERAAWALQRVQDDVRYFAAILGDSSYRPNPPALAWQRRYGDCKDKAYLLTTLLKALGIDASPALVSLSDGRNLDQFPASATLFDHVIVTAMIDGARVWLDPTLVWQRGAIAQRRAGVAGQALILAAGQDALTAMPDASADNFKVGVQERYSVPDPAGDAVLLVVETLRDGAAADQFRQSLSSHNAQELQQEYAKFYRKHFGKLTLPESLSISDDTELNQIRVVEHYLLEDPWTRTETQALIVPTAAEVATQLSPPEQTERVGPFLAAAPVRIDFEARLQLPESWRIDASELDEKVQSPAFDWESQRHASEHELVLRHSFLGQKLVLPADQVEAHVVAIRRAEDLTRQGFRVVPPAQARIADRESRLRAILKGVRQRAAGDADGH